MLRKGVIEAIVPWRHARRVLSMRLRSRLAEQSALHRVTVADPALSRCRARSLLDDWRRAEQASAQRSPPNGVAARGGRDHACTREQATPSDGRVPPDGECGVCNDADSMEEWREQLPDATADMMLRDAAFLQWCESDAGAACVSSGIDSLARQAADAQVRTAAQTAAGRDGLLAALRDLAGRDEAFRSQLAGLLP